MSQLSSLSLSQENYRILRKVGNVMILIVYFRTNNYRAEMLQDTLTFFQNVLCCKMACKFSNSRKDDIDNFFYKTFILTTLKKRIKQSFAKLTRHANISISKRVDIVQIQ